MYFLNHTFKKSQCQLDLLTNIYKFIPRNFIPISQIFTHTYIYIHLYICKNFLIDSHVKFSSRNY